MSRIQNSINAQLHDVLDYHPSQVISPNKANDSPGKRWHQPTLAAHEYRGDLRRDNRKEELRIWIRWLPKSSPGASHEQHQVTTGNKLQKHHGLQLWMVQMVKSIAQV